MILCSHGAFAKIGEDRAAEGANSMGFWDSVVGEVAGRLIIVTGQHKDMFCEHEQKVTDHVSVSWAEYGANAGETLDWMVSKTMDINPVINIFAKPYRCTSCNNVRLE
jgi:hypothetical protein